MLQPPLTYLLGYILEGKQVTGYRLGLEIGGGLIIFVGLVLTILPSSTVREAKKGLGITQALGFIKQLNEKSEYDQIINLQDENVDYDMNIDDIDYFEDDDDDDDDDDVYESTIYDEQKMLLSKDNRMLYNENTDVISNSGVIRKKTSRSTSPANLDEVKIY
jgi:hypothetical protein